MMKKYLFQAKILLSFLFILMLHCSTSLLLAQSAYQISGYVLDNQTVEAIPSVAIKLPNNKYAITESNGRFNFSINSGDTVVFTSIGYTPYTFTLKDTVNILSMYRVYMKPASYQLKSVDVHGEKKKNAVVKATDFLDDVSSPITYFGNEAKSKRELNKLIAQEETQSSHLYWKCNNELIASLSGLKSEKLTACVVYCNAHIQLEPRDDKVSLTHKLLILISEYQKQKNK